MSSRKELYRFSHGDRNWYLTSDSRKVIHAGITYTPIPGLSRGSIEDESIDKCDVEVSFPNPYQILNADEDDLAKIFDRKIYYGVVYLTIMELFKGETLVLFKGRVSKPQFDHDEKTMTLTCLTGESLFTRDINTPVYQRSCSSKVYDQMCGLKFDDWACECTITEITGLTISFTVNPTQVKDGEGNPVFEQIPVLDENDDPVLDEEGQPTYINGDPVMETKTYESGYFSEGLFKRDGVWTSITEHDSNQIKLYMQHLGIKTGDTFQLAPGCDQSLTMCHGRFQNNFRFRGFPNIPNENPVNTPIIK